MKSDWKYLDYFDLVSTHIEVTRLSYDTHSKQYAETWEWNKEIADVTKRDYIQPFVNAVVKNGVVLVVGCGTGRDLKVLSSLGYRYLGIDSSVGMISEALNQRGVDGPVLLSDLESLKTAPSSFDGVLIDSAVEHIKKTDMMWLLEKLFNCLKVGGTLLIRFRVGNGKVFRVDDVVGTRFFTSYTEEESKKLVTRNGFKVEESYVTNHLDSLRPGFHTYILRK